MPIGLGCMRLSTAADRDPAAGTAVIRAALDAGIGLLDTADVYAHDDSDIGHNERLIAAATDGASVELVTKGGLTRPGGAWAPDGRAKHLAAAARASRERLGRIDLYLLHAVDPGTPLATSVRALAQLRDDGIAPRIGLSNINLAQLEKALAITAIDAIEIELSPWKTDGIRGGLVAACERRGIRVLAYRPLGGPPSLARIAKDQTLRAIADAHGATPHEVVLAWLASLGVTPIPGATRPQTIASIARAARLELPAAARDELAARFLDAPRPASAPTRAGEVVLIAGIPAAGKSTLADDFVRRGYLRLNRDDRGGTLKGLAQVLDAELATGVDRVVLDNTYASRSSRAQVIAVAQRHGLATRCIVVDTSIEDAQTNAVARLLARHGRLLMPAELARAKEIDPRAQFRFRRDWEPPREDEGFAAVEVVPFARTAASGSRPALLVELDDLVWRGRPRTADAIELVPGAREALAAAAGTHAIAGTTWQVGLADASAHAARLAELLGIAIHVAHCSHPAGPPVCWCRKPLPGLGLALAHAHDLDLARSLHVGRGPADRGFALRIGVRYVDAKDGWGSLRL